MNNISETQISPLLDSAQNAIAVGNFEQALSQVLPHLSSTDTVLSTDAHRIAGLACFQLKKYADAEQHWEAVIKAKSNERWSDWFNLCTRLP